MATAKGNEETASWWVYVLVCADGTYYTGITTDVGRRLDEHNAGRGARYTGARRPVSLLGQCRCASHAEALRLEARLKRRPRAAKKALIRTNLDKLRRLANLSLGAAPPATTGGSREA